MEILDKVKKDLEVLKSWGIESIPIDKVLDMIGENGYHLDNDWNKFPESELERMHRTYPCYDYYTFLPYSNFPPHNTGSGVPNSYIIVS